MPNQQPNSHNRYKKEDNKCSKRERSRHRGRNKMNREKRLMTSWSKRFKRLQRETKRTNKRTNLKRLSNSKWNKIRSLKIGKKAVFRKEDNSHYLSIGYPKEMKKSKKWNDFMRLVKLLRKMGSLARSMTTISKDKKCYSSKIINSWKISSDNVFVFSK